MIKPLIAANWKMHKTAEESVQFAKLLVNEFGGANDQDIVIAPPFTALRPVATVLEGSVIRLSAQNMHWAEKGAFTGEVSASMIVDAGCECVIIGHSERRSLFGETDVTINKKLHRALNAGLKPILCIGETLEERTSDKTFEVIKTQITEGLNNLPTDDIRHFVIAYEPVWAIGTGKTATVDQAEAVHRYIRKLIASQYGGFVGSDVRIIYGGSVNEDNIGNLMAEPDINGVLVGGASLDFGSFANIIRFQDKQ